MAKITIIDPSPDLHALFTEVVAALGHDVVSDETCNLVILEPSWPDGRRRAARLRAQQPELPIVCVSSRPPDAWVYEVATAYLLKPFGLDDLRAVISSALGLA